MSNEIALKNKGAKRRQIYTIVCTPVNVRVLWTSASTCT